MLDIIKADYFGLPGWAWVVLVGGAAYLFFQHQGASAPLAPQDQAAQGKAGGKSKGRR